VSQSTVLETSLGTITKASQLVNKEKEINNKTATGGFVVINFTLFLLYKVSAKRIEEWEEVGDEVVGSSAGRADEASEDK
jgi:hypothetical protein